jgi:hypothetical protein
MAKDELKVIDNTATAVAVAAPLVETNQEDMLIPFLKVIQAQSDEVTRGKDKYNETVKAGDIYDGVTRQVYTGADIVICGIKKYFAEWTPEARGTLIAKHKPTADVVVNAIKTEHIGDNGSKFYRLSTPDGHDLVETFGVLALIKANGISLPALFTLSKTSFMAGKTLQTMLMIYQQQGVPVFKFDTTLASNSKGSWYKPVFTFKELETDATVLNVAQAMSQKAEDILFKSYVGESEEVAKSADDNELGI